MRRRQLMADERGLSFVEYLIVLCVVALLGFGAWRAFGTMVSGEVSAARDDVSLVHASSVSSPGSGSRGAGGLQGSAVPTGGRSAALAGTPSSSTVAGGATQAGPTSPSGVNTGLPSRPTTPAAGSATGALSAGGTAAEESGSASVVSNTSGNSPGPHGRNRGAGGSGTQEGMTWSELGEVVKDTSASLVTGAVEGVKSALSGNEGHYDSPTEIVGSVVGQVGADFAAPLAGVAMDLQDIRVANNEFWEDPGLGTGSWLLFVGTVGTVPGIGALAKGGVRAARATGDAARGADAAAGATAQGTRSADQAGGTAHRVDPNWRVPPRLSGGRYDDVTFDMTPYGKRVDGKYPVRIFDGDELEARRVVGGPDGRLVYARSGEVVDLANDPTSVREVIYVMDRHGNVYMDYSDPFRVHHSSLAGREMPAAAGSADPRNGRLRVLDEATGHYGPNQPFGRSQLVREEMARQGVDTSGTQTMLYMKPGMN